ncbi:MAG: FG-GAP repeat protein [Anaerolineae bacterium]|nr:FG-GAP repeat protein [Anaerolineae bacterium]
MNVRRCWTLLVVIGLVLAAGPGPQSGAVSVMTRHPSMEAAGTLWPAFGAAPAPDWWAEGDQGGARFGENAVIAGDLDGDGYDDVVVGDWYYDSGATDSGRVFVYYGSATGVSATPQVIDPPQVESYGYFGSPLSPAGDVNGDGYDDLIVSMTNYNNTWSDEGAVFAYYGSATGLGSSYSWMARGNAHYAHLGWDLAWAGDVNGDGYDDIIAGAYRYDYNDVSHAYVWHGSATGLDKNGTRPVGLPSNADWFAAAPTYLSWSGGAEVAAAIGFGRVVGAAGDVNGDGYDDVWVGADLYDNPELNEGGVFVWHGSAAGLGPTGDLSNYDWKAEGDQVEARLGSGNRGLSFPGDYNGDGCDDLVLGSCLYDNPETNEGALFVWYGSGTGLGDLGTPANADWHAEGDQAGAYLGFAYGSARDWTGDGVPDLVVGAPYYDVTGATGTIANAGSVMVWPSSASGFGAPGTPANAAWTARGDQQNGYLGWDLGTPGDVNGDGMADLIASAPLYDHGQTDEGVVLVFHGKRLVFLPLVRRE